MPRFARVVGQPAQAQEVPGLRRDCTPSSKDNRSTPDHLLGERGELGAAKTGEKVRHGIAGLDTDWKGSEDSGAMSSRKGERYR